MINSLKLLWERWATVGLKWPFAYDPTNKQPSITLLMLYFATLVMFSAEITNLFLPTLLQPTLVTIFIWFLAFIMYRLRRLDRVSIDIKDQKIDLDGSSEDKNDK